MHAICLQPLCRVCVSVQHHYAQTVEICSDCIGIASVHRALAEQHACSMHATCLQPVCRVCVSVQHHHAQTVEISWIASELHQYIGLWLNNMPAACMQHACSPYAECVCLCSITMHKPLRSDRIASDLHPYTGLWLNSMSASCVCVCVCVCIMHATCLQPVCRVCVYVQHHHAQTVELCSELHRICIGTQGLSMCKIDGRSSS
jgi:hypothetical protein